MARRLPVRSRLRPAAGGGGGGVGRLLSQLGRLLVQLNDPTNMAAQVGVASALLAAEAVLCLLIIRKVPYTEIDWEAYMQEVTGYLEGERDYTKLKGDTGPLVYPAGFVYLFSWLKLATGGSVQAAQYILAGLYLASQAAAMALYIRAASLPPWSLALLCTSRRLHSIYLLRLFNDCWAMLAAYVATLALQSRRWVLAVVLYSLAVSVKMNVLLMAPGVLAVLLKHAKLADVLAGTALGVGLQLALGAPFLLTYPRSYLARAFEFSRVFTYKWSVNWQFLPEDAFTSRQLAMVLLFMHLRLLWSLAQRKWLRAEGGALPALRRFFLGPPAAPPKQPAAAAVAPPAASPPTTGSGTSSGGGSSGVASSSFEDSVLFYVFSSNIVGIVFARSIHYQFYAWYYHTLPFLLLRSPLPKWLGMAVLGGIEVVYNVYPPRDWASALLLACHLLVLGATVNYKTAAEHEEEVLEAAAAAAEAAAAEARRRPVQRRRAKAA